MALVFTSPKGPAGALIELDSPTGNILSPVVDLFGGPNPAFGQQAAWAINPGTGNDSNDGSPGAPLRTMAAFSARMSGQLVTVAQTLQLVGDVLDAPLWLRGTAYAAGASLTVTGTRTVLGTATINVVTPLGTAGTFPWQLTTTGINWTTAPLGSQLRFSTGHVGFIAEVLGANDVVVGAIAAPGVSLAPITPTVASTVDLVSLSRALPPLLIFSAQINNAAAVFLQDLSFDPPVAGGVNGYLFAGGGQTQFFGCELRTAGVTFYVNAGLNLRACRWSFAANNTANWRVGPDPSICSFCLVVAGNGSALFNCQVGSVLHITITLQGARLGCNRANLQLQGGHIRNTANPVLLNNGGALLLSSGVLNGSTGNTGIGIDVPLGLLSYIGAALKPTVTGTSDTRVGGIAKTYAQIPYTNLELASVPPRVTTLIGNGAAIVQE